MILFMATLIIDTFKFRANKIPRLNLLRFASGFIVMFRAMITY